MSDMRATERLLEVIEEHQADMLALMGGFPDDSFGGELRKKIDASREALTELRRRGDTLVRRDDLRVLMEDQLVWTDDTSIVLPRPEETMARVKAARERLENALGGRLR